MGQESKDIVLFKRRSTEFNATVDQISLGTYS